MKAWFRRLLSKKEVVLSIPLEQIFPNPFQPRQRFPEEELKKLCQSIKSFGVIQPILVRRIEDGYECIAGERRVRAARMAGLKTIPSILRDSTDEEVCELALLENVQRESLSLQDEAESLKRLSHEFQVADPKSLSLRLGLPSSEVEAKLSFLKIPLLLQQAVVGEILTEAQALVLSRLPSEDLMLEALKKVHTRKEASENVEPLVTLLLEPEQKDAVTQAIEGFLKELVETAQDLGLEAHWELEEKEERKKIILEFQ